MPIALPIVAAGIVVAAIGVYAIGIVLIAIAIAIAAFFRDPQRRTMGGEDAVVSGADGRVCDIAPVPMPGAGEETICTRISIFMSPLDVHVNRAPVSGDVISLTHVKGEFRAAFRDLASEHNERNLIRIKDERGRDHLLIQVAGYLARRIVCYLHLDQRLARGERVGLIMFGSRVDHFLPRDYRVTVKVGDRVRAGETIIGELL
ncbi:MAG TPA: phosphatidylserine decarboxylase [Candidatus Binataceae bacterium]|nr:phosphatidylserine decarboxylase [Candidatus Binataceae bacterium]